jgi:hypothetical protein
MMDPSDKPDPSRVRPPADPTGSPPAKEAAAPPSAEPPVGPGPAPASGPQTSGTVYYDHSALDAPSRFRSPAVGPFAAACYDARGSVLCACRGLASPPDDAPDPGDRPAPPAPGASS